MTVKSIALFYGHVARDIGDIAINRGEVALLKSAYPRAAITIVLLNAEKSLSLALSKASFGSDESVRLVPVSGTGSNALAYAADPARWLTDCGVEDADLVVLATGDTLSSRAGNENFDAIFWRILPAFAARGAGKRCLILPSGFGPYETEQARAAIAQLLDTQPRIAARDARSAEALQALAPACAVEIGLDPTFFIEPPAAQPARAGPRVIGLALRPVADDDAAFRFGLALCRRILAESDAEIRMFIDGDADRPLVEEIAGALEASRGASRFRPVVVTTIDGYLEALGGVDRIVASRRHALILGMACGKPGFGVRFDADDPAIPGLMDLLGRPDDCLDLSRMPLDQAVNAAYANCLAEPADFASIGRGIDALRERTQTWLRAGWPARPKGRSGLTPAASEALLKLASSMLGAEIGRVGAQADRLEKEREQAAGLLGREQARAQELERKLAWEDAERQRLQMAARRDAARIAALERRLEQLGNSGSFRLGNALVMAAKSPRHLLRLPLELWNLRSGRGGSAVPAIPRKDLLQLFEGQGVAGVAAHVENLYPADAAARRDALIAASRVLAEEGFADVELELVRKAVETDESEAALRALFWTAQRVDDLPTTWEAIRALQRLGGDNPSLEQNAFLDKARRNVAFQLSLLDRIPDRPERTLSPVPDRICYVLHNSLPYASGGYAARAQGLTLGLTGAGFEVVVLTRPGFPTDAKPELSAADVPLEETVEGIVHRRLLEPSRQGRTATGYMEAAADALTEALARIRPSVVIAASNHQTGLPALIAARRLGLPFFYEIRGFWEITRISREPEFVHDPSYKIQELLEAETAKRADHVFTLTGPMKQEMVRRGVAPEHITLLPNSCEPERFMPRRRDAALAARLGIPEDVAVIGYVGTFVQYEGLELLVAAAAELRDRGHEFRLLLVGNENVAGQGVGPITTEIQRIARRRGLEQWLIMPGRVPHEEVEAYYSLIDIAPFPRKAQPVTEMVSPMKPLEAFAMEKAVVVSSVAALREMVEDGRTGLVFEKDDVASLAEALARLIADPELRAKLGKEARRWVEAQRTWDATARIAADRIRLIASGHDADAMQESG